MPKRLLLVDDNHGRLALLERALASLGHELVLTCGGARATATLAACRPDLVVAHWTPSRTDGLAFLRVVRAAEPDERVPFIALAASLGRDDRLRAMDAGVDDCMEEPVDGALLCARVRALLAAKEARDAIQELNVRLTLRNASLERLHRHQCDLTAFIVHDLKNPLAAVTSNVDFAREQLGGATSVQSALEEAADASNRLRSMIEDILLVSRLEHASFPLRLEAIPLSDLLAQVVREYDRRAEEKRVQLVVPEAVQARVTSDRSLLQRVIENILDNSLRYTPEHGRVGVAARARAHGCVEIAVSNTGPSIPPSERRRIFDKFARLEGSAAAGGNAGLGLYFCKRAVESLGGDIEVTETADWPTSFIVRLPTAVNAA